MPLTFTDLQTEALHDEFDTNKYASLVLRWINEGIGLIARRVELPGGHTAQTINTVAGTQGYALNTSSALVESIRHTDSTGGQLPKLGIEEYDNATSPSERGRPSAYTLYGSNLLLSPVPDRAYTLEARLRTVPADVVAGDEVNTVFPEDYAHLLVSYARGRAFRAEDDFEAAQYHMTEFWEGVNRMAGEVHYRSREVSQVPGTLEEYSGPQFVRPS
jgi:hypothetical protein